MKDETRKHELKCENKLRWWGDGEWVNEPDRVEFEHIGIKCKIIRVATCMSLPELEKDIIDVFGGYFCGYCQLPENHLWIGKEFEISSGVHGGISFNKTIENGETWVGFDCAHTMDFIPSQKDFKKKLIDDLEVIFPGRDCDVFHFTYKNVDFCIEECKKLAEEIVNAKEEVTNEQMDI